MSDDPDNVYNLSVARFHRNSDPAAHAATSALDAAWDWIKSLDHAPDHIIVLVGRDMPDGGNETKYFQAGNYKYHAQQGLCMEGMNMIRESVSD